MIRSILKKLVRQQFARRNLKITPASYQPVRKVHNLGREHHLNVYENEFTNDCIRLSLLDLAVDEIKTKNIQGSVAELGVYQGHFASVLNQCFGDKKLYLFDTFEGFETEEEDHDKGNFGMVHERDFTDTSVEGVMGRMANPANCVVRKGLFPATSVGLENETFAFVSIDTDLYLPIKAGLDFFYDRLETGGFIFVHDYNNTAFPGARKAVEEFSETRSISFVPACDWFGSAIFRK